MSLIGTFRDISRCLPFGRFRWPAPLRACRASAGLPESMEAPERIRVSTVIRMSSALVPNGFDQTEVLRVTDHANSSAREVHALLLEAHPEAHNVNLAKAAHLAETAGDHTDQFQLDTLVAIREPQTAIENGASSAERGPLLLHATSFALKWATARK
jgi:hypothetical protein